MNVKLLTEHHLEFLSLTGGCRGPSESALVKMSNCWNSDAAAHIILRSLKGQSNSGERIKDRLGPLVFFKAMVVRMHAVASKRLFCYIYFFILLLPCVWIFSGKS